MAWSPAKVQLLTDSVLAGTTGQIAADTTDCLISFVILTDGLNHSNVSPCVHFFWSTGTEQVLFVLVKRAELRRLPETQEPETGGAVLLRSPVPTQL